MSGNIFRKLGMDKPSPGILVMDEDGNIKTVSLKEKICYDLGEDSYIIKPGLPLAVNVTPESNNDIVLVKVKIPVDICVDSSAKIRGVLSTGFNERRNIPSVCGVWISNIEIPMVIPQDSSEQGKMKSFLGISTIRHNAGNGITNAVANVVDINKEIHLAPGDEYLYIYLYSNTMWYDTKRDDSWGIISIWFESVTKSVIEF